MATFIQARYYLNIIVKWLCPPLQVSSVCDPCATDSRTGLAALVHLSQALCVCRWKRFKPREAPSNTAQQQVSSEQDGSPAALVKGQADPKPANCPVADAGGLAAVQQPAAGTDFELDLELGLTAPADPCTVVAQAEWGSMQGNGSTLNYSMQHTSRGTCLESAAEDAAAPGANSKPARQPVAVSCTARPDDTGRHGQQTGGRAKQFHGKDNCGAQARESDFSLELDLGGGGAAVGTDGPASCSGAANPVSPFQLELGDLNSRLKDTIVEGKQRPGRWCR